MTVFLVPHTEGAGTGTLTVPCSRGTRQEQEHSVKGISEMTTSMNACEHCNADVTLTPDPECEVVMVLTVAHDDDCEFYQQLQAKREARK